MSVVERCCERCCVLLPVKNNKVHSAARVPVSCIIRKRRLLLRSSRSAVQDTLVEGLSSSDEEEDNDIPKATIHNLVGTSYISSSVCPLKLDVISRLLPNTHYDKQKFAAITVRLSLPYCTCLLFTSGKMVLTGCRNFLECVLASHEIVRLLRRNIVGCRFQLRNVSIQNTVGNVDLQLREGAVVNLERIYRDCNIYTTYQKNMFPGLIYRPSGSPVVLLIFASGKIVITGGKSTQDVKHGWKQLWPFVRGYIEKQPTPPLA